MDQRCDVSGLVKTLRGLDLASADGRAGLGALLRELERAEPGLVRRLSAEAAASERGVGLLPVG
jgi:hypothetical protein